MLRAVDQFLCIIHQLTLTHVRCTHCTAHTALCTYTQAEVTLVLALRGESLKRFQLERSVNSASAVRAVLQQLASDTTTDEGENVLGAEILWTPEEPWETLDRNDVITDFPELRDL
jgi:uncharacterized membrane protein